MTISPKNNLPAWFMSASHCPVTGLAVTHAETFVSTAPGGNFRADAAKLGDYIFLIKSHGYADKTSATQVLHFLDDFIKSYFDDQSGIIYIEDYAAITGADAAARKNYIAYLTNRKNLLAALIYNVPTIFKIGYHLFKKLNIHTLLAEAVDTYEQAIDFSLNILEKNGLMQCKTHGNTALTSASNPPRLFNQFFNFLSNIAEAIRFFCSKRFREQFKKQYSEALLTYIASIDWQKPGGHLPENKIFDDSSSKKIFDTIGFVQSEIYSLLEERRRSENALKESEEKYRLLVEHTKAGICEYDYHHKKILNPNQAFLDITGYSKEEILSMGLLDLLNDEGRRQFNQRLSMLYSGRPVSSEVEYQIITKKGEMKWVLSNVNVTFENNLPQKANIAITDITRLKTIENQLLEYQAKLKKLSVQLSMSEEKQRRLLASRFHDDISQELFVAQLQLDSFEKKLDNPVHVVELSCIKDHIVKLIKQMRDLIFDLSPPVLYDFGFKEALETLARVTQSKHGIEVATQFSGDMDRVNDEIKIILYRSIKELIYNAIKHAKADRIIVSVHNAPHAFKVDVTDDGIGLDVENFHIGASCPDGFGLFDIREKMNHLGGKLTINSAPGRGTSISMEVPVKQLQ